MAIYHYSSSFISRAKGQSAVASAAYQSAAEIVDERTGEVKSYGRKERVDHSEIQAPKNAPEWATDRARLWNEVEQYEKRVNSQLARKINLALPQELTPEEQRELMRRYVQSQFVDRAGIAVDWSIHDSRGENPHAHLMMTTRELGPEGFGQKRRDWYGEALVAERAAWADECNRALREAGHEARIDHRSLEAQGLERVPQIHLGPKPGPDRLAEAQDRREANRLLEANRVELGRAQGELREITATLEASPRKAKVDREVDKKAPEREPEALRDKASDPIREVDKKFDGAPGQVHQAEPQEAQKRPQEAGAAFERPTPRPEAETRPAAPKRPQEAQDRKVPSKFAAKWERERKEGLKVWPEAEREPWRAGKRPELKRQVALEWQKGELERAGHSREMEAYDASIQRARIERQKGMDEAGRTGLFGKLTGQKGAQEQKAKEADERVKRLEAEKAERDQIARKAAEEAVKAQLATPQGRERFSADVAAKLEPMERQEAAARVRRAELEARRERERQEQERLKTMTPEQRREYFRDKRQRERALNKGRDRER